MPATPAKITRNPRPLPPDGSFQGARLPVALRPGYVEVDGYTTADWVEYVHRLAERINFIGPTGVVMDDWGTFYRQQPAVAIGRLLSWPLQRLTELFEEHRELIENVQAEQATAVDTFPRLLDSMFSLLASAVVNLEAMITALPPEHPLREQAVELIKSRLAPALHRWVRYYRAGQENAPPLVDPTYLKEHQKLRETSPAGGKLISMDQLRTQPGLLSSSWSKDGKQEWTAFAATLKADATIYGTELAEVRRSIVHAVGHQFFHGVYELLLSSALHLRAAAQKTWEKMLAGDGSHQPHLTLLLAFLRTRLAQRTLLNGLTDRHLNFYYEQVLRLKPGTAVPPSAHLTVELRKRHPAITLPAGTTFRGGKDPETKLERLFRSTAPTSILPVAITDLRALYKVDDDPLRLNEGNPGRPHFPDDEAGRYYAATVVNSSDGAGGELPEGTTSWHPFGYRHLVGASTLVAGMSPARMGLIIASPWLLLREGLRTITLTFTGTGLNGLNLPFNLSLSTEEGWHQLTGRLVNRKLEIELDASVPAILPYAEEVHQLGLSTEYPVLKIELPPDAPKKAYTDLRAAQFTNVNIDLLVKGIRQLTLSGSAGAVDPSGPFYPFGAAPRGGEVLYIGHPELAVKAVTPTIKWTWNAEFPSATGGGQASASNDLQARLMDNQGEEDAWEDLEVVKESANIEETTVAYTGLLAQAYLDAFQNTYFLFEFGPKLEFGQLAGGIWNEEVQTPSYRNTAATLNQTVLGSVFNAELATAYRREAKAGFIGIRLDGEWGHGAYPATLAAGLAKDPPEVPTMPFNPELRELTLDYSGTHDLPLDGSAVWSLTPFGFLPAAGQLVPQLVTMRVGEEEVEDTGEDAGALLVGIQGWDAATNLSLLFQVEDGSADNLLDKPENHLQWAYLDGNDWAFFPDDKVNDGTRGLLQTGVVTLGLPFGVDKTNTRMGGGEDKTWIRLSVASKVDAVSYLRGLHVNALTVVQDDDPALEETFLNLPAGSIAKPLQPLAGVKKIVQPYAAFGARPREARDAYFTRHAERLRHKDRAITEWDVEQLVLEAFPEVDRVICLQHYRFVPETDTSPLVIDELAAGHLTVLPIGRSGGTRANPLRPYVSLATRKAIEEFLLARLSDHATLHVRNPLFDEVMVSLTVRFHDGTDRTWAEAELRREIVDFISPWHDGGLDELNFAAAVHPSVLVNYLEELPFVDYIKDLGLEVDRGNRDTSASLTVPPVFTDAVTTDLRIALLVAVAPELHDITVVETATKVVVITEDDAPVARRRPGRTLIQFTPKPAPDGDND